MKCKFCNKKCINTKVTDSYCFHKCKDCDTEYRQGNVINIFFTYNNKKYYYQQRDVYDPNSPARFLSVGTASVAISLKEIPKDITPSNVLQKFSLYALFS